MKNIKLYLAGITLLLIGSIIGWMIKPSSSDSSMSHQHDSMEENISSSESEEIWTCSMHPQVRQNEPGICPICEMDLIPLDNNMANDDPTILQMSNEAVKLAQIETTLIGSSSTSNAQNKSRTIQVEGTVQLDDRTINVQSSHVGGRIESMYVNFEGQYISKGSMVATIYSTDLLQASQELLTAAKFDNKVSGIKDASIQKLKNWKLSDQQIQSILDMQEPIETINIYAENNGYILERKAKLGDYVSQGAPLYTICNTNRVWLIFNVFESDMESVKRGQNISFTSPSIGNKQRSATISYIDPLLDEQTRTAKVRAEISNPNNSLMPGMLLTGTIEIKLKASTSSDQIVIPNSAILWTGDRSVVYVRKPEEDIPTYQFREVTLGIRMGDNTTILSGIENGEEVVTNGAFAIDAAAQLNNNMSMMNKNVTIKKDVRRDVIPNYADSTPEKFKDQLDHVVTDYIELKDALVQTDASQATPAMQDLLMQLEKVDMTLLEGQAQIYWMDQLNAIIMHGQKMVEASDIEQQRNQFDHVSKALINSLRAFGTNENSYFVQYCPMAKDNQGASWIALEEQIQNPYFGDKMMKCGSVKLEL